MCKICIVTTVLLCVILLDGDDQPQEHWDVTMYIYKLCVRCDKKTLYFKMEYFICNFSVMSFGFAGVL